MAYWLPIQLQNEIERLEKSMSAKSIFFRNHLPTHSKFLEGMKVLKDLAEQLEKAKTAKLRLDNLLKVCYQEFPSDIKVEPPFFNVLLISLEAHIIEGFTLMEKGNELEAAKILGDFQIIHKKTQDKIRELEDELYAAIASGRVMVQFMATISPHAPLTQLNLTNLVSEDLMLEARRGVHRRLNSLKEEYLTLQERMQDSKDSSEAKNLQEMTIVDIPEEQVFFATHRKINKLELIPWNTILQSLQKLVEIGNGTSSRTSYIKTRLSAICYSLIMGLAREQDLLHQIILYYKNLPENMAGPGKVIARFDGDEAVSKQYFVFLNLKFQQLRRVSTKLQYFIKTHHLTFNPSLNFPPFNPYLCTFETRLIEARYCLEAGKPCAVILKDFPKELTTVEATYAAFKNDCLHSIKIIKSMIAKNEELGAVEKGNYYALDFEQSRLRVLNEILAGIKLLKKEYIEFAAEHTALLTKRKTEKIAKSSATKHPIDPNKKELIISAASAPPRSITPHRDLAMTAGTGEKVNPAPIDEERSKEPQSDHLAFDQLQKTKNSAV